MRPPQKSPGAGDPGESRGNPAPPGTSCEELVNVPADRLGTQVAFIFPFWWDLSLISTQGFSCTSRLARSPLEPTEGSSRMQESVGNHPAFQVPSPPRRAFSVHPIP